MMPGEPTIVDIHKINGTRPRFTKYIGRVTRYTEFTEDSKWCNPFTIKTWGPRAMLMFECYARRLLSKDPLADKALDGCLKRLSTPESLVVGMAIRRAVDRWGEGSWDVDELTGEILGCWCVGDDGTRAIVKETCHGQVWRRIWREKHS